MASPSRTMPRRSRPSSRGSSRTRSSSRGRRTSRTRSPVAGQRRRRSLSSDNVTLTQEEYDNLKRQARPSKDNTKTSPKETKSASWKKQGRGIARVASLFDDVQSLYDEAIRRSDEAGDEEYEHDASLDEDERRALDRTMDSFNILCKLLPFVEKAMVDSPAEELTDMFNSLWEGSCAGRNEDNKKTRILLAECLNKRGANPRLDGDSRSNRGTKHDLVGKYLCPVNLDWDDPEIQAKIREGDPDLDYSYSVYARAFYPSLRGDPQDLEKGFLKNTDLVKVFASIFTSGSSVKNIDDAEDQENVDPNDLPPPRKLAKTANSRATKKPVAHRLRMNGKVTPRAIAYAAVMYHFNLTDANQWQASGFYQGFDYRELYNTVIDFFEDLSGLDESANVAKKTLAWWNKAIFPDAATAKVAAGQSRKMLKAQRKSKAASE